MDPNSLANLKYEEQKRNQWPGLAVETCVICQSLNIENCNTTSQERSKYLELIKVAFNLENERKLRLLAVGKCQRIIGEDYGKKEYISKRNIFIVRQQ